MESISRIGSLLETARDLTLDAARDAGPRKTARQPLPPAQIKKLLDSRTERDILDGLRRITAMQCANPPQPTLTFFPSVVKTLSNSYASTRPLVYNYIVRHAESDPDTALLSINTIQKSLSDTNPRVRALSLKTMASIRVPVISQIVSLAIKRGVNDLSPLVRKTAAMACVKCIKLDPSTKPQIEEFLGTLLADKQYYVVGAAVQAFLEICPERIEMIHPVYRSLCKMVVDMDDWGQLAVLRILTRYGRLCFPRKVQKVRKAKSQKERAREFYEEIEEKDETAEFDEMAVLDPDLDLFLKSIQQLLQSRNSAIIVAVAKAYLYLAPETHLPRAIAPLIALLRSPKDLLSVALHDIVQICLFEPKHFVPYFRHFLIRALYSQLVWTLKIEVLTLIFPHTSKDVQDLILAELEYFSRGHDADLVKASVRAIGRCAQYADSHTSKRCLTLLLKQIHSVDKTLVSEAIDVVRQLIQRSPNDHRTTVVRLAKNLDTLTSPSARASIIWLVGEFVDQNPEQDVGADVLRILLKGYADENDQAKAQIVLLAAKIYLHHLNAKNERQRAIDTLELNQPDPPTAPIENGEAESAGMKVNSDEVSVLPIEQLYQHAMLLARYTSSYDLRDRARVFRALLAAPSSTELASLLLLAPKPVPLAPSPSDSRSGFVLGTATLIIGEEAGSAGLQGYEPIPDWVEEGLEPSPKLRDDGDKSSSHSRGTVGKSAPAGQMLDRALAVDRASGRAESRKEKTLDDWLDEKDAPAEGSESEDESEEESDGEDEYEDSDEETDDSEEESDEEETESEEDEQANLVRR